MANEAIREKAKESGVKVVATNDVNYVAPEDLAAYSFL